MPKIKRGRYLETTRNLKLIQLELSSCSLRLKRLVEKVQRLELASTALDNSITFKGGKR